MPKQFWNRNLVASGVAEVMRGFCSYGWLSLYSTFLIKQLHYAPMAASVAFGAYGLGAMFGWAAGWVGDRFSNRWISIAAWCLLSGVWYCMYSVMTAPAEQRILSFLGGICVSSILHPNVMSLAQRSVRPELVGRATGFYTSCNHLFASFSGFVFGFLVQLFGWSGAGVIQLTICPLIAIVALLLIKDKALFQAPKETAVAAASARS